MSMLAPANTYDVRCPKMVVVCIIRCAEHAAVLKSGCFVHISMRRAGIP